MNSLGKMFVFIIGVGSILSLANAVCETPKCFDCNKCNRDCTKLEQNCDSDCLVKVRQFLCNMENENCKKVNGCDVPPVPIAIYPASKYDESRVDWKALNIEARKNCCYNLSGIHNNTLSGLKNNGACVQLYDGANCSGASIRVDSSWTIDCLKWIDCPANVNKFNDKTSSFQLC